MNGISRLMRLRAAINFNGTINKGHTRTNNFSTSSVHCVKEIRRTEKDGVITIEGVFVPSPRENNVIPFKDYEAAVPAPGLTTSGSPPVIDEELLKSHSCPLCKLGMPVKHTDVLILSQFLRADGGMLPRRVTGLCREQQKRVSWLTQMAHKAGLMPNLKPGNSHFDPKKRQGWYKYNKYYEEEVIDDFLNPAKRHVKKG